MKEVAKEEMMMKNTQMIILKILERLGALDLRPDGRFTQQ